MEIRQRDGFLSCYSMSAKRESKSREGIGGRDQNWRSDWRIDESKVFKSCTRKTSPSHQRLVNQKKRGAKVRADTESV